MLCHVSCIGLARTIYICVYGVFGREITKYKVIYGVDIQFWLTLVMHEVRERLVLALLECVGECSIEIGCVSLLRITYLYNNL